MIRSLAAVCSRARVLGLIFLKVCSSIADGNRRPRLLISILESGLLFGSAGVVICISSEWTFEFALFRVGSNLISE